MAKIRKVSEPKPIVKIEPVKRVRPIEEVKQEVKKPIKKVDKNDAKPKNEVKKPIEKAKQEVKKPIDKGKNEVAVKKQDNLRKTLVKTVVIEEEITTNVLIKEPKKPKPKSDDKYVRFASKDYQKNKLEISEKIQKNEMKFAYFAIDGEDFYHYYILTKNN
jgi:hypothetical protein